MEKANVDTYEIIDNRMRMRVEHNARVEVFSRERKVASGELQNISQQGLYLSSIEAKKLAHQRTSVVSVKLWMQDGESCLSVEATGLLIRVDSKGCAISFTRPLVWWPVFSVFPARARKRPKVKSKVQPSSDKPLFCDQLYREVHLAAVV